MNHCVVCPWEICCGSNFLVGFKIFNQFDFYFPLSLIVVKNLGQRKIEIKLVLNVSNQRKV